MMSIPLELIAEIRKGPSTTWEASLKVVQGEFLFAETFFEGIGSEAAATTARDFLLAEFRRQAPQGLFHMLRGKPLVPKARAKWVFHT